MTEPAVSPLRQRMIEDMTIRRFGAHTQRDYIRQVRAFTAFLGRSPDRAEAEDLRRYQLHLASFGASYARMNQACTALRFFFHVTLGRTGFGDRMARIPTPERLPVVLSPEEVALLLAHAPSLKDRAALSIAYGCGLRVSEIANLKVCDIDSARMLIRVEQGKGRKDRYVMLAPDLLDLLRHWWRVEAPARLALPRSAAGPADHDAPAQPRLSRRDRGRQARQAGVDAHAAAQLRHASAGAEDRYPGDPGPARPQEARHHRRLYPRRPKTLREVTSPLALLAPPPPP